MKKYTYYDVLGISRTASLEDIKIAYKNKLKKYHPDRNRNPAAESKTKLINKAYSVLTTSRSSYDERIATYFTQQQTNNYAYQQWMSEELRRQQQKAYDIRREATQQYAQQAYQRTTPPPQKEKRNEVIKRNVPWYLWVLWFFFGTIIILSGHASLLFWIIFTIGIVISHLYQS